MLPGLASEKVSWNPVLITIGLGILLAIVSFVVVTSQWGRPTTSVATAGFFGILFGILIFAIGCIWLIVKIIVVVSRSR
jgi:apolipoprotein N-acyltransferase